MYSSNAHRQPGIGPIADRPITTESEPAGPPIHIVGCGASGVCGKIVIFRARAIIQMDIFAVWNSGITPLLSSAADSRARSSPNGLPASWGRKSWSSKSAIISEVIVIGNNPATGIEYHRYGTHIFHTSNERVWSYIRRFTSLNTYRHQVLSCHKGHNYQFPINLGTINQFYNVNLRPFELDDFMATIRDNPIGSPANFEEQALALLGRGLYETFFEYYRSNNGRSTRASSPLPFSTGYLSGRTMTKAISPTPGRASPKTAIRPSSIICSRTPG